jgi:hypothetical protein
MSEENAELLRLAVDAYNRREVEALCAELDPEVEWHPALPGLLAEQAQAQAYRGHAGIGAMFDDFDDVLGLIHLESSDGKGIRIRGYPDPEQALEEAGLAE